MQLLYINCTQAYYSKALCIWKYASCYFSVLLESNVGILIITWKGLRNVILIFSNTFLSIIKFTVWWIGVVRFENSVCNSTSNLFGTCYTRRQCRGINGTAAGRCAQNIAVCCVGKKKILWKQSNVYCLYIIVQLTCGTTALYNNTYFVNPNFPNPFIGQTRCVIAIRRCNVDICQVAINSNLFKQKCI